MRDFVIRIATKKDIPAISRFGTPVVRELNFYKKEHMARNVYELSIEDLNDTFKSKDSLIVAESRDGKIVGMVAHYPGHGHVDWLDWIIIDKNYRKKGLGKAMINFTIKEAKRRGCHKIWCDTHPKNTTVNRFLKKFGFRKVGILKKHSFKDDQLIWEKIIE